MRGLEREIQVYVRRLNWARCSQLRAYVFEMGVITFGKQRIGAGYFLK